MSIMDEEGYGSWGGAGLPVAPKPKPTITIPDEEGYGANPVKGDVPFTPTPKPVPKTVQDFIRLYGSQAALAASYPEIMDLLQRAVAEGWTTDRFKAEFQNTKYFQTHAAKWRVAEEGRLADPGEYAKSLENRINEIKRQAILLGIQIDDQHAKDLADQLLHEYWGQGVPPDVMNQRIMELAKASKIMGGATMSTRDSLKEFAAAMGVKFDEGWFEEAAKATAAGTATIEQWKAAIKDAAKSRFPMFADQIEAGQTVDQVVSPYKQTLASILEIPYTSITLDDPSLSQAFGSVGKDGKPAVMGLWDYEKSLRNDPRWAYTKNARSSIDSVARKVLQDFGMAY